jgi:hypothetical protein
LVLEKIKGLPDLSSNVQLNKTGKIYQMALNIPNFSIPKHTKIGIFG